MSRPRLQAARESPAPAQAAPAPAGVNYLYTQINQVIQRQLNNLFLVSEGALADVELIGD